MDIDERTKLLQKYWNVDGFSGSDISKLMNCTRSAVSGMISRAKAKGVHFEKRTTLGEGRRRPPKRFIRVANDTMPPRPQKPSSPRPVVPVPGPVDLPKPLQRPVPVVPARVPAPKEKLPPDIPPVTFMDKQDWHCNEVVGRIEGQAAYCGQRRLRGQPYCAHHNAGKTQKSERHLKEQSKHEKSVRP